MCIVWWMLQCGGLDIFTNVILVYHFPITIFKTCMYWDQGWIVHPRVCIKCRHHTRITRQFFLPSLVMCCLYVGSIKIKMCNQSKYNEVLHYSTKLYRSLQLTYSFPITFVLYVLFQVDYGCVSQAGLEVAVLQPSKSWHSRYHHFLISGFLIHGNIDQRYLVYLNKVLQFLPSPHCVCKIIRISGSELIHE